MRINQPCNLELDIWGSYEQNDKNKHLSVCFGAGQAGVMTKMDDVASGIAKSKEEKDNAEKGFN